MYKPAVALLGVASVCVWQRGQGGEEGKARSAWQRPHGHLTQMTHGFLMSSATLRDWWQLLVVSVAEGWDPHGEERGGGSVMSAVGAAGR